MQSASTEGDKSLNSQLTSMYLFSEYKNQIYIKYSLASNLDLQRIFILAYILKLF